MQAPAWDADFAASRAHGAQVQMENLNAVMQFVQRRRRAVDAGAHIGLWTQRLVELFDAVLAAEPVPENYECLRKNVPAMNATLCPVALGAEIGGAAMVRDTGTNSGCWHVSPGAGSAVYPLDYFGFIDVDLLKIDVEGAEGLVVKGAQSTIAASQPAVIFEDNGVGPRYFGSGWIDPKPLLRDMGYRFAQRIRKDEIWIPG